MLSRSALDGADGAAARLFGHVQLRAQTVVFNVQLCKLDELSSETQGRFVIYHFIVILQRCVPDDAAHVVADAGLPLRGKGRGVGKLPAGVRVVGHGKPVILILI